MEKFIEFRKEEIDQSIPARFEDQVRKHSRRLAIKTSKHALTYDELNKAANRLAHAILARRGERQEQLAILCHQGAGAIIATLAVLKAGKTYVPLDPMVPHTRNKFILGDAQVGFIIADAETISLAGELAKNN